MDKSALEYQKDAMRYRFLRDEVDWEVLDQLMETDGADFDAVVDVCIWRTEYELRWELARASLMKIQEA